MVTAEDLAMAKRAARDAKRIAHVVKGRISGRMAPEPPSVGEASELATAADTLAYHVGWMAKEIERLRRG